MSVPNTFKITTQSGLSVTCKQVTIDEALLLANAHGPCLEPRWDYNMPRRAIYCTCCRIGFTVESLAYLCFCFSKVVGQKMPHVVWA